MDEITSNIIESLKVITADAKEISKEDPETSLKLILQAVNIMSLINCVVVDDRAWMQSLLGRKDNP